MERDFSNTPHRRMLTDTKDDGLAPVTVSNLSMVTIGLTGLSHQERSPALQRQLDEIAALAIEVASGVSLA